MAISLVAISIHVVYLNLRLTLDKPARLRIAVSRFLFGMVVGAVLMYVAMHYHIVRGNQGVFLVPKLNNNLSDVFTDTREFELDDWRRHKPLAAAIMQSDQSQLLEGSSLNSFRDSIRGLVDGLFGRD